MMERCNSLIRLSVYLPIQEITNDGINLSGSFCMMENIISSDLLCSLWKNSFVRLRSFNSISIIITPLKVFEKNMYELEFWEVFFLFIVYKDLTKISIRDLVPIM